MVNSFVIIISIIAYNADGMAHGCTCRRKRVCNPFKQRRHVRIWSKWRQNFSLFWWTRTLPHRNWSETRNLKNKQEKYPGYASRNSFLKFIWCVAQIPDPRPKNNKTSRAAILLVLQNMTLVRVKCLKLVIDTFNRVQVKEHFYCVLNFSLINTDPSKDFR